MDHVIAKLLTVVLCGIASSFLIAEEDSGSRILLSTGVEGGGYWNAGSRLQRVAEDMNLEVENLPSSGSLENLDKLFDDASPVNLAFAQADAVQHYLNTHEEAAIKLEMLENIGQECVFIVTDIDSDLRTNEDMEDAQDLRLGIPSATSGVAVTLNYMASQIPEMADIDISYGETAADMEEMGTSEATVDAVMMVHRPKERSPEVNEALEHPDRYRFVEVSDDRLTEKLWSGHNIYRTIKLVLPGISQPLETICVNGLLLANRQKLTPRQRNGLNDLVSYNWIKVYATQ
ncbi:MAG: hypothetical protein P8J17_08140 [Halioglobus sp.]|nr:hypothetical protein [Halioglobus sp.]